MFNGKEFCVINGSLEYSKQVIERKIAEVTLNNILVVTLCPFHSMEVLLYRIQLTALTVSL